MKTIASRICILSLGLAAALPLRAETPAATLAPAPESKSIPFAEIGAKATADYTGDAIGIVATAEGARLHTGFQKLAGTVTPEGLRLDSTAEEGGSLKLTATSIGRTDPLRHSAFDIRHSLPATGSVSVTDKLVTFTRPGLVEEYSVSVDGVRQDFIVAERPAGADDLRVELALSGATAEAAADGVKLILAGSGRELVYNRLRVTDATGRELAAALEVPAADRIAVRVEDAEAVYPVRIDPTFSDADWVSLNPGVAGTNGPVYAAVADGSGNLYIGGSFTTAGTVATNNIAKWNGSVWSALGSGMNNIVTALAVSGTDLYAGGEFTTAGGGTVNYIAKWNGSAWSALGSGMSSSVQALAVSGTDLYAGGSFTTGGGVANYIARWNGSAWSALGSGTNGPVQALAVIGPDLYAGGGFTTAGGVSASRIAKWNGSTWSALGSGMNDWVEALAVSGTDLYAGGTFTTAGGVFNTTYIAKWNGNAWSALGTGMNNWVYDLAVIGTDLYAGGTFTTAGGGTANRIAQWNGSSWSALSSGINTGSYVHALAVSGTNLYAGGGFTTAGGVTVNYIAKWDASARWWSALRPGINDWVYDLAVSGTDLYAGGTFTTAGGVSANRIAKWNGSAWSTLGTGMNGYVRALAVSGSDLYAGGYFTTAGGGTANRIAKWNGSAWSALGTGMNGEVRALAVIGTDLYAGGHFTTAGGVSANRIAKWNGSAWLALGSGMNNWVDALAVSGTDLYAGGAFTTAGGVTANYIAKWNGSAWSALGSGMSNPVYALAAIGSNLYAGGTFSASDPLAVAPPKNFVARWDGSAWSALGSGMNSIVYALAVSGTDLYAGGDFTTAGGASASRIARWNGSAWSALGSGMDNPVYALAADTSSHLFVGGLFSLAGTTVSPFIAQANLGQEIAIEQPAGTNIASGGSRGFGPILVGSNADLVFTLRNPGTAPLTLSGTPKVAVSGPDAAQFSVTAQPSSPVPATGSTTFTVRFTPASAGAKTAALSIANDDADENPFLINLTGTGATTFTPTFTTPGIAALTTDGLTATGITLGALTLGFAPAVGTNLTLVNNTGLGFIGGTFGNLAQGQVVPLNFNGVIYHFVADYFGGTGNDLVLVWKGNRAWAWGLNSNGQLGDNSTTQRNLPVPVTGTGVLAGKTVVRVATGENHSLALCSDGTVAAWGSNASGQLGDSSTTQRLVPEAVNTTSGVSALFGKTVVAIAAGSAHSMALCSDGTVAAWGGNTYGQLGSNSTTQSLVPVAVNTASGVSALFGKIVTALSAGLWHSMALCSDGTVVAWGWNNFGQLGDSSFTQRNVPVAVNTASGVSALFGKTTVAITAGSVHSVALCSDGTVATWGNNSFGQLGDNSTTGRLAPVAVNTASGISALFGKTVAAVATGDTDSLALCADGTVVAWGSNDLGQLGDNTTTQRLVPVAVNTASGVSSLFGRTVVAIGAGYSHSVALCQDGTVAAWGNNSSGQLGDNSSTQRNAPIAVNATTLASSEVFTGIFKGSRGSHTLTLVSGPLPPIIAVEQPAGTPLTSGTASVPFGTVLVGQSSAPMTFTIRNSGPSDLTLGAFTLDGADPGDFTPSAPGSTTVAPGDSTTFTITFSPAGLGARTTVLHIPSNDPALSSFDITLTGTGVSPEIAVEQPTATDLADGTASIPYGGLALGTNSVKTFTIRNTGTADLTGLLLTKDGADAADFTVDTTGMAAALIPGGSTTFAVTFAPGGTASSARIAAIHIASSDLDENPFDIGLTGTGLSTTADFDGDGLNDWAEFQYAALGFDWETGQPSLVSTLSTNANLAGLFTQAQYDGNYTAGRTAGQNDVLDDPNAFDLYELSQVQALHVDAPLLERDPMTGKFTLTIGIGKAANLIDFAPFPFTSPETTINGEGKIEFEFPASGNAAFFRIEAQ